MSMNIKYEVKTANGFWNKVSYVTDSMKEFNNIIKIISLHKNDYKLISFKAN